MAEETTTVEEVAPVEADVFCTLNLTPRDTLTTYNALRFYLQNLAVANDKDRLDTIAEVVDIMKALKPAAAKASQLFAPLPPVTPTESTTTQ